MNQVELLWVQNSLKIEDKILMKDLRLFCLKSMYPRQWIRWDKCLRLEGRKKMIRKILEMEQVRYYPGNAIYF